MTGSWVVAVVSATFDDADRARAVGRELVELGLAACAHVGAPVTSVYRWEGVLETAEEWVLECTTSEEVAERCVEQLVARHPYELPQVLVDLRRSTVGYSAWVRGSVGSSD